MPTLKFSQRSWVKKYPCFPGSTGKHGVGIRHIIEERVKKDNLSENEITALSALILETVRTGEITRDSSNRCEITKNGIIAIVRKDLDDEHHNWVLTGFAYKEEDLIKKEKQQKLYKRLSLSIVNHLNTLTSAVRWELLLLP